MNLGKIVLQLGCSDKIIQQIYPIPLFVIVVLISRQKHKFMLESKMTM
jgi:hypothetical protein